mmetsp:Transcript_23377/g.75066  ORF Transcript_23377/g.75066 Transcript_23377/m.75066 type:complete len:205 (+) Transcript_23377:144-758(+)
MVAGMGMSAVTMMIMSSPAVRLSTLASLRTLKTFASAALSGMSRISLTGWGSGFVASEMRLDILSRPLTLAKSKNLDRSSSSTISSSDGVSTRFWPRSTLSRILGLTLLVGSSTTRTLSTGGSAERKSLTASSTASESFLFGGSKTLSRARRTRFSGSFSRRSNLRNPKRMERPRRLPRRRVHRVRMSGHRTSSALTTWSTLCC